MIRSFIMVAGLLAFLSVPLPALAQGEIPGGYDRSDKIDDIGTYMGFYERMLVEIQYCRPHLPDGFFEAFVLQNKEATDAAVEVWRDMTGSEHVERKRKLFRDLTLRAMENTSRQRVEQGSVSGDEEFCEERLGTTTLNDLNLGDIMADMVKDIIASRRLGQIPVESEFRDRFQFFQRIDFIVAKFEAEKLLFDFCISRSLASEDDKEKYILRNSQTIKRLLGLILEIDESTSEESIKRQARIEAEKMFGEFNTGRSREEIGDETICKIHSHIWDRGISDVDIFFDNDIKLIDYHFNSATR